MSSFPDLGFSYGVFAASIDESFALALGFRHTDDEDNANRNDYAVDPAWMGVTTTIVSDGVNTDVFLAQVR
jgi:hypothetical protein